MKDSPQHRFEHREIEKMGSFAIESEIFQNPRFVSAAEEEETHYEEMFEVEEEEERTPRNGFRMEEDPWSLMKRKKNQVYLEGYVEAGEIDQEDQEQGGGSKSVSRTMSLTDEDLDELKGCVDLGFGFSYEEIPELCNTLPALELCYSMSQRFLDEHQKSPEANSASGSSPLGNDSTYSPSSPASAPIANWKISSPGDNPEEVKARLKFWAQTVACTVRLCS